MLNSKNERELCYLVQVDDIEPIPGRDFTECAVVGGWRTLVKKDVFKPGDIGIYIEIDSKTPEKEPFDFLEKYHYKVKTQKFKTFYSQGLLMHPDDFGWPYAADNSGVYVNGKFCAVNDDSRFLTSQLGITYATAEDNKRKAPSADKYKKMAQRHPDLFKKKWARWMMKRTWGKKVMFFFFGKKKDKRTWPAWVVKTDEERIENLPHLFKEKCAWFATEKVDGSSTTFTMKRGSGFHKPTYLVCSRNVCFDTPEKADKCFYDSNIYLEMSEKYHIQDVLEKMLKEDDSLDFVTIQGETYGEGVQKKTYKKTGHDLAIFNVIFGYKDNTTKRLNPREMTDLMAQYELPCVPIIDENYILPDTIEELRAFVNSEPSKIDGEIKEGIVFRSPDGAASFKCVSPEFLLQYHC